MVFRRTTSALSPPLVSYTSVRLTMSYDRTRALLYRGIIVTINSGLWTAILAIIDFILVPSSIANHQH